MALTPLNPLPFSPDEVVVTVSCGRTPEGHTGLGFFDEAGVPVVYHLNGDHQVLLQPASHLNRCFFVEFLKLPPGAGRHLTFYIRAVVKSLSSNSNAVDYGIDFISAHGSFSPTGDYTPPPGSLGLTCASFVVEILKGALVDLIDAHTWQALPENITFGNELAAFFQARATFLEQQGSHAAAANFRTRALAIINNPNGLRLKPVEVGAAAGLGARAWPASFTDVQPGAQAARIVLAAAAGP